MKSIFIITIEVAYPLLAAFGILVCVDCIATPVSAKDIEVIIGGKSYYSMDSYRAERSGGVLPKVTQPEKIDQPTKQAFKALKSISSEEKVGHVQADFEQNWEKPTPKFTIDSKDLEQRLEAIAGDRKKPVLIVSDEGKLRVLMLGEDINSHNAVK